MRQRQRILWGVLALLACFCLWSFVRLAPGPDGPRLATMAWPGAARPDEEEQHERHKQHRQHGQHGQHDQHEHQEQHEQQQQQQQKKKQQQQQEQQQHEDGAAHPIRGLVDGAARELEAVRRRQSTTLEAAVAEYRRRYRMAPPPYFEKWFAFARRHGVQLVDEFDSVHELLTPFWGLRPGTIRARVREALGGDNMLLGVAVRGHRVSLARGGPEWQRNATQAMMAPFLDYLPDMDLAFNLHDEPRVVVPHDDLARLMGRAARAQAQAAAAAGGPRPANGFTASAADLGDGLAFAETKLTRFNVFSHQPTWTHSRMSCPPDSPARALDDGDNDGADDRARYGLGPLGFVYNATAMSDICLSPSLAASFGFFDRPNAYNVVHDLVPVFSQSKVSSYHDIVYPSPWYWNTQVAYDERQDRPWAAKKDQLYWRGSTTGGFSRHGGWRRQHRQRLVARLNARDRALVLDDAGRPRRVARADYRRLVDVHFSHVGQCDPGDCDAQRRFFDVRDPAEQHDAWAYRHLLDVDGNAFSGRFYAFLHSRSLTFKLALFREWHAEWLKPWAHFVPLSLQGDDWLEVVRFFSDAGPGRRDAERIAAASREWAAKVVRKEDMEAWFFRLLLECVPNPPSTPLEPPPHFL